MLLEKSPGEEGNDWCKLISIGHMICLLFDGTAIGYRYYDTLVVMLHCWHKVGRWYCIVYVVMEAGGEGTEWRRTTRIYVFVYACGNGFDEMVK